MNTCKECGKQFDPGKSTSFFAFDFCSQSCEDARHEQTRDKSIYLCIEEFDIQVSETKRARVKLGSKYRLENAKNQGLADFHLINISGKVNEPIAWLEVSEKTLLECFRKVAE